MDSPYPNKVGIWCYYNYDDWLKYMYIASETLKLPVTLTQRVTLISTHKNNGTYGLSIPENLDYIKIG